MKWRLALLPLLLTCVVGCSPVTLTIGGDPADNELVTTVIDDGGLFSEDRVAIIDVSGMIFNGGKPGLFSPGENPVALLHEQLEAARKDSKVKAVILRLNTPGGTVTASDVMYREVMRFKERTGKPVIALMLDVAASGGYYLACSSDTIVAYPTTVTGSIGVIFQTISFQPGMSRIGITAEALTSGPNKDAGSPFGTMSPEQRATLQRLVDNFYARFTNIVRTARPKIPQDHFAEVTDGRVFSGDDALKMGLVDQLGDLYDAFAVARERAGIKQAKLVRYHRPHKYVGSPYAAAPNVGSDARVATQLNLVQLNVPDTFADASVGFYYLWLPGAR